MAAFSVVVPAPGSQHGAGMVQRREQRFVQECTPQTAVETFDEGIPGRLVPLHGSACLHA